MGIFHYYKLTDSEAFIFDDFLICQIREGAEIRPEHSIKLNEIIQRHFEGERLVYISNRVNSYSVDPLTYKKAGQIPNLIAIAVIPETQVMRKNAEFEKKFFNKPYEIFDTLNDAIQWAHTILQQDLDANKS